jgi:hypothetical protein
MVADGVLRLTPVTNTCVADVVAPAAMKTLAGDTVTFDVSLLARLMVTPPVGAFANRDTANVLNPPIPTDTLPMVIEPRETAVTVTLAVADVMPVALAVIVTGPPTATPVTVTVTLVAPAVKFTVAGTVATPVALEVRFTVKPAGGACPLARLSVKVPVPGLGVLIVRGDPEKVIVGGVTVTVPLPEI